MSRRLATAFTAAALTASASLGLLPGDVASAAPVDAAQQDARGHGRPGDRPGTVPLPDNSSPEGIAGGPGSTFFAGSRADGSIYRGDLRTGKGANLVAGRVGAVAVGMQYDARTRLLWVAGGATGTVTAYDGRTGRRVATYSTPPRPAGRFLNDVDVTSDGVFVTDSLNAELVVVRPDRKGRLPAAAQLLPLTGDWAQTPTGNNANGIRGLPGGDLLVVDQGALLRIDPHTGVAKRLAQTGGEPLTVGDGLELRGSTLYVVYGFGRDSISVVRLGRGANSFAVTGELTDPALERPTTATLDGGFLYAVNGKFTTVPTPTTFEVVRVPLR